MTLAIAHSFVSAITDSTAAADAGEVLPSGWNANHTVAGAINLATETTGPILYISSTTTGPYERIAAETAVSLITREDAISHNCFRISAQAGVDGVIRPIILESAALSTNNPSVSGRTAVAGTRAYYCYTDVAWVFRELSTSGAENGNWSNITAGILTAQTGLAINNINFMDWTNNTPQTAWSYQGPGWASTPGFFSQSAGLVGWSATNNANSGIKDIVIARDAAGVLGVISSTATTTGMYRDVKVRDIYTTDATFMHRTASTITTTGAAAGVGTLTNAPASTNPTKWIPIDDNGTTRYIPAW